VPFIVLSLIVQIALVVHVVRTGRNMTWIFVVLFFPFVGSAAYFIVEILPELQGSRGARNAKRKLSKALDPGRELREAVDLYEAAPTAQNAMRLAALHLQAGAFDEARSLYARSLTGVHGDDPELLLGLAQAEFGIGHYAEAITALDRLKANHPKRATAEGHLLYARALQGAGRLPEAIEELEALARYYPGPEPACRLAQILSEQGEEHRASELYENVLRTARTSGKPYGLTHKAWIDVARRATSPTNG